MDLPKGIRTALFMKSWFVLLCMHIYEEIFGVFNHLVTLFQQGSYWLYTFKTRRSTHSHRRESLKSIAQRFQVLANQVLKSPADLPSDDLKLRGQIQVETSSFAINFRKNGHSYEFSQIRSPATWPMEPSPEFTGHFDPEIKPGLDKSSQNIFQFHRDMPPTPEQSPSKPTRERKPVPVAPPKYFSIYTEIRAQMLSNRCGEPHDVTNLAILRPLMRKQTSKWKELAESHCRRIASMTMDVSIKIMHTVCAEQDVPPNIRSRLVEFIRKEVGPTSEIRMMEEISKLCQRRTSGILQTNNAAFVRKAQECRELRFKTAIERYRSRRPATSFFSGPEFKGVESVDPGLKGFLEPLTIVDPGSMMELFAEVHHSQQKNIEDEIHDLLKACYEVVQEGFLHDILDNIIEDHLSDTSGPLMGFSPDFVKQLSEERIRELLAGIDIDSSMGEKIQSELSKSH